MVEPSLRLSLGETPSRARLRAAPGREPELRRLALRFPSSEQLTTLVVELPLDELMTHIAALQHWDDPSSVEWDDDLATIARDSLFDARTLAIQLASGLDTEAGDQSRVDVAARLGTDWQADLTPFQVRDVAKLLTLRHGANFSVPGAGKTRVALAVFAALRNAGEVERLLIVGPKSSYEAWSTENVAAFSPPLDMRVLRDKPEESADALIVNYERLAGSLGPLSRWLKARPTMLILDEAHRMKLGAEGTYGSACLTLAPHSRRRLILTGTPTPNGVKDLENLFSFVWPGTGRRQVVQAVASGDLAAASRQLSPLFTRTTKAELGLPKVSIAIRRVELTPLHREVYDALLGQVSARALGSQEDLTSLGRILIYLMMAATSPSLLSVGTTRYEPLAYQVGPLDMPGDSTLSELLKTLPAYELAPKFQQVIDIVTRNAALGRKTLVWSTFIRNLTTLKQLLKPHSPALIHGGTKDRDGEILRFREDPSCMVLLSNPATLGEGISLHHECHDAIYVDRDFAAGRFLQSVDRIHRLGLLPDTETRITVLSSVETIDEVIEQRLGAKISFMRQILDDPTLQVLEDLDEEPITGGGLTPSDTQALIGHIRAHSS